MCSLAYMCDVLEIWSQVFRVRRFLVRPPMLVAGLLSVVMSPFFRGIGIITSHTAAMRSWQAQKRAEIASQQVCVNEFSRILMAII